MITSHRDVKWLYNAEVGAWHALDEEIGMPFCGTSLGPGAVVHTELPEHIVAAVRQGSIFETRLCAACARVVKLHRG